MRSALAVLSLAVMVIYTAFRLFTTAVFLPLTATPSSDPTGYAYSLSLVILAITSTVLSSISRVKAAAGIAIIVGLASVLFWWIIVCNRSVPIWSDFNWFVVPEITFALAAVSRWRLSPRTLN